MLSSRQGNRSVRSRGYAVALREASELSRCPERSTRNFVTSPSMSAGPTIHSTMVTLTISTLLVLFTALSGVSGNHLSVVSSNGTSSIPSSLDRLYAQNAVNLVRHFESQIRDQLLDAFNRSTALLKSSPSTVNRSLTQGCYEQVRLALHSPLNSTSFEWLLQMYDSSGSTPTGIVSSTTTSLGDFDQCLRISETGQFEETKYCLLTLHHRRSSKYSPILFDQQQTSPWVQNRLGQLLDADNKVPIVVGLCVPAQCTSTELGYVAQSSSSLVKYFDSDVRYCQSRPQDGRLSKLLPFLIAIAFIHLLSAAGSFLDFLAGTQFGKDWSEQIFELFPIRFLRCFSAIHNTRQLFNVKSRHDKSSSKPAAATTNNGKHMLPGHKPSSLSKGHEAILNGSPVRLDILDGLRVFAIVWIIISHCATFTMVPGNMKVSPFAHYPEDIDRMGNTNWFITAYVSGTYYAVSIFFMISGILVMYNRKRNVHCDAKVHFAHHFVNRVFRLAPAFLATMGVTYYLRYLGSGPMFHQDLIGTYVEPCRTHFWYHFFLVHNYLSVDQRCGSHTWYVGADFQLQIIAFFVIHLARCRSRWFVGLLLAIGIIGLSSFIPFLLVTIGVGQLPNFNAYVDPRIQFPQLDLKLFYYSAYVHAPTFFIGVVLGYILSCGLDLSFLTKNKLMRFSALQLASFTMFMVPPAMRYFLYGSDQFENRSPLLNLILFQFFSYTYNIALAGFILVLALNPKMYIAEYLSSKCMRPLARLVFSSYLTHQMLIWFFLHQSRAPFVLHFTSTLFFAFMILGLSTCISMYFFVMIECPFIRIGKLIFPERATGIKATSSRPDGHFVMRSISTAESFAQRISATTTTGSSSPNEHIVDGTSSELESIISEQPVSQFTRPVEGNSTDQNNNKHTSLNGSYFSPHQ